MTKPTNVFDRIRGKIIVSCQPVVGGPMDSPTIIACQALAAEHGGAAAVRLQGAEAVRSVARKLSLPIIGITKRNIDNSAVRITPLLEDVDVLVDAGACIVAFDATRRDRPVPTNEIVRHIRDRGAIAMADCASVDDAKQALDEGAEILATTLSGYAYEELSDTAPPDLPLVAALSALDAFVIAEGRYQNPDDAAAAIANGADAVVVGSAITRIEHITRWYADAIDDVHQAQTKAH